MKFSEKYGNSWLIYSNLCDLRCSYNFHEMVMEDVYDVDMLYGFKTLDFVNSKTIERMNIFQKKFNHFITTKIYSKDRAFAYLDKDFISILDNELKDFLESLNADLLAAGFTDVESLEVKTREFPSNELILERVSILFQRLEKK
jgi:hypothetical protein